VAHPSLLSFPDALNQLLSTSPFFLFGALQDLASCSRTCSYLRSIAGDDRFWRRAYAPNSL